MEYPVKRMSLPQLRLIERSLKGNYIFRDENVEVSFNISSDEKSNTFEISLFAKKKKEDIIFRLETRVALEQHSEKGHNYPHLQINNFASDEELMKKGTLRIVLLVQSVEKLEQACNSFVYNIGGILNLIEGSFKIDFNLKEFFFNPQPFEELKNYSNKIHELITRSFKVNKLVFKGDEIDLIEFKGRKNEPSLDVKDLFKILRILLQLKFLNPILLDPILSLISEDPKIKSKCTDLSIDECKKSLLNKRLINLKHYNRDEFIKEFTK